MLTRVVTLLLALGAALLPTTTAAAGTTSVAGPPEPDLPSGLPISVDMTTHNDGRAVSLLEPRHPAWAHLAPSGEVAVVTATVELHGNVIHQWVAHLDTPDAFQGVTPPDCGAYEEAPPHEVTCDFPVQAVSGVNRLEFHFVADGGRVNVEVNGAITGGAFDWDAGWEVLDATGQWSAISRDQTVALPATLSSALRYVVTNTGDIPFRAMNGCHDRLVPAHVRLICAVRGVRPVQSLAGRYHQRLHLVDVVGATAQADIQSAIQSFAGVFSLAAPSVTVGQPVVVRASGLPRDTPFALQVRIDDEPIRVSTSISHTGTAQLSFPLPSSSPGTAHVDVTHDGLTIARLPFEVTLVPRQADAPAPLWLWLTIPFVLLGGLLVTLIFLRRRRRRPESREASASDGRTI